MATTKRDSDRRFRVPPPGFVVLREQAIDPEQGRHDRWTCRGVLDGRTIIRSGLRTQAGATRAAWFAYDDACTRGMRPEIGSIEDLDSAVAEALARRFAIHREHDAAMPEQPKRRLQEVYCVRLDSWAMMEAALIEQIVTDAGSIRRACKIVDVPRSTFASWIHRHKVAGTWPTE